MSMLPRLKSRRYDDLVVEVAIGRPGPIQGGVVQPYLRNRVIPEGKLIYPSSKLEKIMRPPRGGP